MIKRKLITAGFVIAMAAMVMSGCKSGGTDKETTAAAAGETAGSQESGTASGETKSEEELTDEASLELGNYKGLTLTAVKAGVTDEDLEAELENLKTVRRKDVAEKIKEARGQGDLSENAEYDAAKEEQAEIEARIVQLEKMLRWARDLRQPVLLHVVTQKGRGISYTEQAPEKYHGVSSFDPVTGALPAPKPDFSHVFGQTLSQLADEDPTVVAITAAMLTGTGLETFAKAHPERLYDVGIAEGHAITMASGMAKQGLRPVAAIYSSFLQRAYDMLIHDTSLQRLHLVLGVDRAGIVGNDGDTHNGCFDISYLSSVPYMRILCPASFAELRAMLRRAVTELEGPVAVRYPRGGEGAYQACSLEPVTVLHEGSDLTLLTYGIVINDVLQAAQLLAQQGISAEVVKLAQVAPLEAAPVLASLQKTGRLLAVEDVCAANCIGEQVLSAAEQAGLPMKEARLLNLGSGIIPHGAPDVLKTAYGLDAQAIAAAAQALCANDREKGNGA